MSDLYENCSIITQSIHSYIWIRTDLPRNGFIHCNHLFPKYDSYIRPALAHQHGDRNKFVTKKRKEFLHLDVLFCLSLNSFLNLCNCYMYLCNSLQSFRCGSRIWSRGGPQLQRPKVANVAKRSRASEASNMQPGSRARLRALEAFGFLMLKYAFSHILETLFLSFLTSILTPKVDKNRALELTSINLRHSYILHLFFNLHEKVMV